MMFAAIQAGAPAAAAAPATTQQRFDAATAAQVAGRCNEAVSLFTTLEQDPKIRRNALASAAVAVRKGICMVSEDGREAAEASIRQGLPTLEKQGGEFSLDVARAHLALGTIARSRFDYAGAVAEYLIAVQKTVGVERVRPLLALSQVTMFDGDGTATGHGAEALRIATETKLDKDRLAIVRTQYARALLNAGRTKEAYDALKLSLKEQGGLGTKVGLSDIVTRSDLAIAAMLSGSQDEARNYLAYTGAGRMRDTPFNRAASMDMPLCGGESGLKPDDVAVVEFTIAEDGHVSDATPIYTLAGREAATAFARAVAGWSWEPTQVASIPAVFRYATRVEMRCTRAGARPGLMQPLRDAAAAWFASQGLSTSSWDGKPDAVALPLQRAALADATASGNRPAILRALLALSGSTSTTVKETRDLLRQAAGIDAATPVRALVAIQRTWTEGEGGRQTREMLRKVAADPAMSGDPLVAATLAVLIATPGYRAPAPTDAPALLQQVIDAPGLPARHPLKVTAMLQRANMLAAAGDLAGAEAIFARTGLTEEQCALIQPTPLARRSGASAGDYPMEAVRMGFEGWVQTEFDIAADGTTIEPRTVAAYPPFIFSKAGQEIGKRARFTSSYRPNGSVACAANRQSVKFLLPTS